MYLSSATLSHCSPTSSHTMAAPPLTQITPSELVSYGFGKLVPKNVVSTYTVSVNNPGEINLGAVALVCQGKYGRGVFPAVVSKARIPISGVEEQQIPAEQLYPLHKKTKVVKAEGASRAAVARSKKIKALLQEGPKGYLTATDSQFKSGQNVVAGGTSVVANMLIAYQFIRRVNFDLGLNLRVYNMMTQNIVCSCHLGFDLNTEWLVQEADLHGWQVFYKPEEFIGLSWITNEKNVKIVYVIFSTGNIVATGLKSMEHIPIALERMNRLIVPFRRGNEPASFDPSHPHMRDEATLKQIKTEVVGGANKTYQHAKANAAQRNGKKLLHEVRAAMKQIDVTALECNGDDDDADFYDTELNALSHFKEMDLAADEEASGLPAQP